MQSPRQVIFTPGRKQISIRRYWFLLFVSVSLLATLSLFFNGFMRTSVLPVLDLNGDKFVQKICQIKKLKLEHDVSIGLHSVWRGELTLAYNYTTTAGGTQSRTATAHSHVSGSYTNKEIANDFLEQHELLGKDGLIECFVDYKSPYHATTIRPQVVYSSVIFALILLGVGILCTLWLLVVASVSFLRFVRNRVWDEERGVWMNITQQEDDKKMTEMTAGSNSVVGQKNVQ